MGVIKGVAFGDELPILLDEVLLFAGVAHRVGAGLVQAAALALVVVGLGKGGKDVPEPPLPEL